MVTYLEISEKIYLILKTHIELVFFIRAAPCENF